MILVFCFRTLELKRRSCLMLFQRYILQLIAPRLICKATNFVVIWLTLLLTYRVFTGKVFKLEQSHQTFTSFLFIFFCAAPKMIPTSLRLTIKVLASSKWITAQCCTFAKWTNFWHLYASSGKKIFLDKEL